MSSRRMFTFSASLCTRIQRNLINIFRRAYLQEKTTPTGPDVSVKKFSNLIDKVRLLFLICLVILLLELTSTASALSWSTRDLNKSGMILPTLSWSTRDLNKSGMILPTLSWSTRDLNKSGMILPTLSWSTRYLNKSKMIVHYLEVHEIWTNLEC